MVLDNQDTTNDSPLTMSEAVKAFDDTTSDTDSDEEQPGDDAVDDGSTADDDLPADEDGKDEGEIDDEEEQSDTDKDDEQDDEAEEQDDGEQERVAADDFRVKLDDGTFTTVADLKAGALRRDDYTRKTQETAAEKQQTVVERTKLTQLREANEEVRGYTIKVLEQFMPTKPDDAMFATDFIRATQMEREYNQRQEQLQYLKSQREWDEQQTAAQRGEEARELSNTEWSKMLEHPEMADLKDETKGKALISDLLAYGKTHGYEESEVRSALAFDHRQAVILKKAMAHDQAQAKLKAAKAKVPAKIEGRPPVQKGSKRINHQGQQKRQAKVAMDRLSQTGSFRDGLKAYLASD